MNSIKQRLTPYLIFDRDKWSELKNNVPLTLTDQDLKPLLGINEDLSLDEISTIFLPLVRLLNFYIEENILRQNVLHNFLNVKTGYTPYIIGIAGSVASGKSTTARILQAILSQWPIHRNVDLITTDGFLYDLATLAKNNITLKKGFPESYDMHQLLRFMREVKSGKRNVKAPLYSHVTYDIIPNQYTIVDRPDVLILEGLNILQNNRTNLHSSHLVFVSDFVDFSIYINVHETLLEQWFLERFLKLREMALQDPTSYLYPYTLMSSSEAILKAREVWKIINVVNLRENILPTKDRADLILTKGEHHTIETVQLRK